MTLQLKSFDPQDLQLISAHVQDSIVIWLGMDYDANKQTFSILANRFCWEYEDHNRVHSGLCFLNVKQVLHRGFSERKKMFNLLCLRNPEPAIIELIFSEGMEIRLHVNDISVHLKDLEDPWPTNVRPIHYSVA